ncbi:MAG TPA: ATP synthase F0 subunit B [Chthonomonadales bacterium]|nr:ATP synthase F0 subunit B [Chthonomonadales bacterium]
MAGILDTLNVNLTVLLATAVLFITLVLVMDRLFWRRVLAHLDARRQEIARAYEALDTTRRQLDDLQREYEGRLARIEADARVRIQQTVRDAQMQRDRTIADARDDAARVVRDGAIELGRQHDEALVQTRERLAQVSLNTLERVVGQTPSPEQRRLVEEYIAQCT